MRKQKILFLFAMSILLITMPLLAACGDDETAEPTVPVTEPAEKVEIVIGHLSDFSGRASAAMNPMRIGIRDYVTYINEDDPIPGVTLRVEEYDNQYDPARDVDGYEWLKEKDAQVILAPITSTAETLKIFAEEDKIPVMVVSPSKAVLMDPPGWVFSALPPNNMLTMTMMEWISTQPGYDTGTVKVASVAWNMPAHTERVDGVEAFCDSNPRFEHISVIAPPGTVEWIGEILTVEDFEPDLIHNAATYSAGATFLEQFRARGNNQKTIAADQIWAFQSILEDAVGKEGLDGSWAVGAVGLWGDTAPLWQQSEAMLYENNPDNADMWKAAFGTTYTGSWAIHIITDIIRETVNRVGAENFDGEAFFDTLQNWSKSYEGFEDWTFADGKRYCMRDMRMYEYDASLGRLVKITDWIPLIED